MRIRLATAFWLGILLAGCDSGTTLSGSKSHDLAPATEFGFMEATTGPNLFGNASRAARSTPRHAVDVALPAPRDGRGDQSQQPSAPQIAYSYGYGFRADAHAVTPLQQRHVDLCESMGQNRCRVLSLTRSSGDDYGYGRLQLQVAAAEAREFGERLSAATEGVKAEMVSFSISGEDLTDDLIDTEARLAARELLRDRLMEVLRTRQGAVSELVQAERGVAEVNEEIDAARSRLANLRNRVAMSAVSIEYDPFFGETRLGFSRPIAHAIGSVGTTLGMTIAVLIYVIVAFVPIVALLLGLRWIWRKSGFRLRRSKARTSEAEA